MYILHRFGNVTLPQYGVRGDLGGSAAELATVKTVGGTYDANGQAWAALSPLKLRYSVDIVGDTPAIAETTALQLMGLTGKRDRLYRLMEDGTWQWAWARVEKVSVRESRASSKLLHVTILFVVSVPWWGRRHGPGWTLDSGEYLDSGLVLDESDGTFTMDLLHFDGYIDVYNNGNYPTTNIVLEWMNPASDIEIYDDVGSFGGPGSNSVTHIKYTHTGTPTTSAVINCATRRVQVDGADAYSTFSLGSYHKQPDWLRAEPGTTRYWISGTGGGTMKVTSYDAWV